MSPTIYFITLGVMCGTPLLIFGMKYLSAAQQARSRALAENATRELAEKATAVQSQTAASLAAVQTSLADIESRLAVVEKLLKSVE